MEIEKLVYNLQLNIDMLREVTSEIVNKIRKAKLKKSDKEILESILKGERCFRSEGKEKTFDEITEPEINDIYSHFFSSLVFMKKTFSWEQEKKFSAYFVVFNDHHPGDMKALFWEFRRMIRETLKL